MGIDIIVSGSGSASNVVPDYDSYLNAVYEMNDSTGSTIEDAHGSFDLTKQAGSPTFGATGINGAAITQDSTSYFTRAFGSGFGFASDEFAISTWIKFPNFLSTRHILAITTDAAASTDCFYLRQSSGTLSLNLNNGTTFITGYKHVHDTWHNVIISRHSPSEFGSFRRFYMFVDGICIGQSNFPKDYSSHSLSIGRSGSGYSGDIVIDQTRIYSGTALGTTAKDIAQFAIDMWNNGDGYFDWS